MKRHPSLKKSIGLFEATMYGVGLILGAGIYALIGEGAALAGNSVWISFILSAIISSFTAMSYSELSSMYPKEAAEYVYTKKAFKNNLISFMIGFMFIVAGIVSSATVSLGFGGYLSPIANIPVIPVAIGLIVILSLINFIGIGESSKMNVIFSLIETGGLVIIIILGLSFIGSVDYTFNPNGITGILGATALMFFAFIGFEDIANISEETKTARKVIPKAIILSIAISSILYILVSISSVSILGYERLSASNAPLTDVAGTAGFPTEIFTFIALFATANTVLILLISTSRTVYGMANMKSIPKIFSRIHNKRSTPWIAILLVMIVSSVASVIGNIKTVAGITTFLIFIIFCFVNLSLIVLRYKKPNAKRLFKAPLNIGKFPVLAFLGFITSFFMLFNFELQIQFYGLIVFVIGLVVYFIIEKIKNL